MGGRGHHPCRNERSLNRGPDNSVLIFRSLDFFFLPPFLSMVFYNVSNDRAREQFSRTRLNVNERLKKKGIYLSKIGILLDIDECLLLFLLPFRICRSSSNISDCSRKRNVYSTVRKHYRNVTLQSNIFRISRKISGLIKSHDEPSRVVREERPFDFKDTHFLGGYTYSFTISLRES